MATLCLQKEEMIAEKVQGFPVLYDKRVKGLKEKVAEIYILKKTVILLEQVATENILKIAVLKNLMTCSVSEVLRKY